MKIKGQDLPLPPPAPISPPAGGLQFKDAAPLLCGVVDNGVDASDQRVMTRTNEATKMILDYMIPVGGMATANVTAFSTFLVLPPEMENCIEAFPADPNTTVYGDKDITQGWYEIVNNSTYLDPSQHHDNPLIDLGLFPDDANPKELRRVYEFPGLFPDSAVVTVTGAKRYIPLKSDDDYLIVQNIEALKLMILAIERLENNAKDESDKYRQSALELLQAEVKKHILDPRNYMRRKSNYQADSINFPENTMGWMRANVALDLEEALKMGKQDLTWAINQCERRLMQRGLWKDTIVNVSATVTGGLLYFPINVASVLAVDLGGRPIPVRSRFFQHLENGPGMFPAHEMLISQGDQMLPGTDSMRRVYKLIANCTEGQRIEAICKLRWTMKKDHDFLVIKNYEAIRLMMTAKLLEEKEQWQEAAANQQQAYDILDKELREYLGGIKHTVQIQTYGFGLGDVGGYWTR